MADQSTLAEFFRRSFREAMKDVYTCVPGHVIAFDPDTQLAQLQIGIERVNADGSTENIDPLIECPINFPGGDYLVEYQIDPGTEGMIHFSQRCIDGWLNTGGVARNPILRFHDISDAYFVPGLRSQPNVLSNFQNNGVRLRNKAGDQFIWLKNNGDGEITVNNLNINANINHVGNTTQTGDHTSSGTVTGTTDVVAAGVSGKGHGHLPGAFTAGPVAVTGISGTPSP